MLGQLCSRPLTTLQMSTFKPFPSDVAWWENTPMFLKKIGPVKNITHDNYKNSWKNAIFPEHPVDLMNKQN